MIDLEKRAKAWDEFSGESMEWTVSNTFNAAYKLGVRDGAASVDRAGIVREALEFYASVERDADAKDDNEYIQFGKGNNLARRALAAMEEGK